MTNNTFPVETGNAAIFNRRALSECRMAMIRWEYIFDFLSEEPNTITVREREDSTAKIYVCILRIRFWGQRIWEDVAWHCSWSIYADDDNRNRPNNIVLRRVLWDSQKDGDYVKKNVIFDPGKSREFVGRNTEKYQEMDMAMPPSVDICNKYIAHPQPEFLLQLVHELDTEIENGFILYENAESEERNDLELQRLYDWGQVHMTWCPAKKNERVERCIKRIVPVLNAFIEKDYDDIYSMVLNYDVTPERYRNWFNEDGKS